MFKSVNRQVWAFDAEWIPDPVGGRMLHKLSDDLSDREVMEVMWREGGATEDNPTPFLKTVMCRLVSIVALSRTEKSSGEVELKLHTLPRDIGDPEQVSEQHIIATFLQALGKRRPQIVGFNSLASDIIILIQRGMINGVQAADFCHRPDKPWEGVDYFARGSEFNIDLKDILGAWGKGTPSLHELATLSGVPGKMDVAGEQVAEMWLNGRLADIVAYNECDAFTTYLVWLRLAYFGGHFTDAQYEQEQQRVRELLQALSAGAPEHHLSKFQAEWTRLEAMKASWR